MNRKKRDTSATAKPKGQPGAVSATRRAHALGTGFPVVGVGASAGGLEAFQQLLSLLPADTGMAFVVVQHLDPTHPSLLAPSLAKATSMVVTEAQHGLRVEPNHVYVIPPNVDLAILQGTLTTLPRSKGPRPHMSIDFFFRALSADEGPRAIGVLLSGTGSDGTEGLRAIKAEGGIALAQDPGSAKFGPMPEHAIAAGVVDRVLPPEDIARELARLARHPYLSEPAPEAEQTTKSDALQRVLVLARAASGIDFSGYKLTTIERRLARRMALKRSASLDDYADLLQGDPAEAQALCRDVLIHITDFFRDADAFDALAKHALPEIIERHRDGSTIRIWVPGCSTGEEAYSIAITLLETLGEAAGGARIQIFGSDISAEAIETARAGVYPESVARDVGPERLKRFFTQIDGAYRIAKSVRDLCVFVKHDVTRDPPFAKLDLVSCRNVLIYFGPELQKRVLPLFHYCLSPGGFLFLGRSETVAGFTQLFSAVDKNAKIFRKVGTSRVPSLAPPPWGRGAEARAPMSAAAPVGASAPIDAQKQADNLLLARYAPAAVLVNGRMEIVQIRGRTGPFLELAPGQPNLNLLKLAREGLLADLRIAFERAVHENAPVRREGLEVGESGHRVRVDLEVAPVIGLPSDERFFLVLFETPGARSPSALGGTPASGPAGVGEMPAPQEAGAGDAQRLARIHDEMSATKQFLQSLLDERQRMNDELTSANEELVSSNEELQSTNEELETAKEELESTNEELRTINDELHNSNQELNLLNSDLVNLLASVDIPIVIVDGERRVRRFTPRAKALMNLIPGDVGRPIDDIKLNVDVADLERRITEAIETVSLQETEVRSRDGHWYKMQIRPYRTVENKLDGAVLSLIDIDVLKRAVDKAEETLDYLRAVVETVRVPLVVLDAELRIVSANRAYRETFGGGELEGRGFFEAEPAWDTGGLQAKLRRALPPDAASLDLDLEVEIPKGTRRLVAASGNAILWAHGAPLVLLSLLDVTERAALLAATQEARSAAEQANRMKDQFLATLSHELRTPLSSILLRSVLLQREELEPARVKSAGQALERAARIQAQLIDDLLDVSRIGSGKLELERRPLDPAPVVAAAVETMRQAAEEKGVRLRLELDDAPGLVCADPTRLQQVLWNLLTNAVRATPAGGDIAVTLARCVGEARIRVADTGKGIEPSFLPHVFDRFSQADGSSRRLHGGLGLGLSIVRDLIRLHGGSVHAESAGEGRGATFTVTLPLIADGIECAAPEPSGESVAAGRGSPRNETCVGDLGGTRVLIVEDDAPTREALVDMLRSCRAEIRAAGSAAEAMGVLEAFRPEVLLCDVGLPGVDGYELLHDVRSLGAERGGHVAAVALTSFAGAEDRERALAAGFQIHLAKPASPDAVCHAIRAASRAREGT